MIKFAPLLQEGSTYFIEGICVGQNDIKFRRTHHKYKLSFIGTTRVTHINAPEIPQNAFDFADFRTILQEHRTDLYIGLLIQNSLSCSYFFNHLFTHILYK